MTPTNETGPDTGNNTRAAGPDAMARLRAANPVPTPPTAPPAASVLDRRAVDDLERILDSPRHPQATVSLREQPRLPEAASLHPRWCRRLPLGVAALGAAAAIVVGVVGVGVTQPGSAPIAHADTPPARGITALPATVDGAQTLRKLATLAAAQPAVDPVPYLFTEAINYTVNTSFGDAGTTVEVVPSRSRVWLAPRGQVHRETVSAGGTDAWSSNGVLDPTLISPAGAFVSDYAAAERDRATDLSIDPAALLAQLNADGPGTDGGLAAGYLADLFNRFQNGLPTPAQQSAIWEVLAGTGEFKTLGDTTDRAGRPAVAVSYDTTGAAAGRLRYQLLISPDTGLLLGFEQITLKQSPDWQQQVPAVTGGTTFLRTATAERPGEVPAQ